MEFAYNIVTESKFDVWARAIFKMFADCMRTYKWLSWKLKFECSSTVRDKFGIEKCEHTQEHSMFTKDKYCLKSSFGPNLYEAKRDFKF